jgi:soluble lytic murein transglycosylase
MIDWVESIPYPETRNYVQRVIENLQVYRARLGGPVVAEAIVRDLQR